MSKRTIARNARSRRASGQLDMMSLPALAGMAIGLFGSYILAEVIFVNEMHTIHWLVTLGGAALGYLAGMLYEYMKTSK